MDRWYPTRPTRRAPGLNKEHIMKSKITTVDQFVETFPLDYLFSLSSGVPSKNITQCSPIVHTVQAWAEDQGYLVGSRVCRDLLRQCCTD